MFTGKISIRMHVMKKLQYAYGYGSVGKALLSKPEVRGSNPIVGKILS